MPRNRACVARRIAARVNGEQAREIFTQTAKKGKYHNPRVMAKGHHEARKSDALQFAHDALMAENRQTNAVKSAMADILGF